MEMKMPEFIDPFTDYIYYRATKDKREVFNENLSFWYLEMPKFKKEIHELKDRCDQWFYILNNLGKLTEIPISLQQDLIFKHLFMEAKISNYSEDDAIAYMASMKERWDRYAEKKLQKMKGD